MRIAAVHRKICGRCGDATVEQPRAGAGEAKEIENIGLRTVWDATQRMSELVKCDADQQTRAYVGSEGSAAVIGGGVISCHYAETRKLRLCIPDSDLRLPLDR